MCMQWYLYDCREAPQVDGVQEYEESEAPAGTELPDLQLVEGRRWLQIKRSHIS